MKYPFQKKSFWIIFTILFLMIFLFPPIINRDGYTEWRGVFDIQSYEPTEVRMLTFEMIISFLLNYLGHLIFLKPEKKLGDTIKGKEGVTK
ncbi:MAG: hypothetical protein COS40_08550 [Deltaproteobacteria bacterium CG03_land_8_20_14_0_80_45_14]|nr:MAG: hypothetical protein COS40_08550 [Deltaproteobacteria bacterium CG03_land_8_20_14_0_80_45_14]